MDMKIPGKIVEQATKCRKDFHCLANGQQTICPPVSFISGEVLFIKPKTRNSCYYKMSFGNSFICNCPVRKEIYKRYKI